MYAKEFKDVQRESDVHEELTGSPLSDYAMAEMMLDLAGNPAHDSVSMDITFSNWAYGVVIGENPELLNSVSGCPRFGDVVCFKSLCGVDSPMIEVAARCMGDTSKFAVRSLDGARVIEVPRDRKPVLLSIYEVEMVEFTREELENKLADAG